MRHLDESTLRRFLAGLLAHLKNQGAILHPVLGGYIESWGNTYRITQRHIPWMPNFGPRTRAPIFLTTKSGTRFDPVISQSQSHRTWYQGWAEKCFFPIHPLVRSVTEPLYALVLKGLTEAGVMEERWIRGDRVWGIRPETLRISKDVLQFRCRRCGHNASVAASEKNYWDGSPCLRFHCSGRYEEQEQQVDYYGKMYTTGDLKRIFAAEHTGLLQRDDREDLERRFKAAEAERMPWDPNLLSCTPTLEMGIDIGDLSSIILCSMPPAQANYLQRIGRAGRRDGNALNLTVANARPHDLYFFADPAEMIAGRIEPPGVFLNASAVLERQLSAFCFDRWVESGIHQSAIPSRVGQVLNNLEPVDKQKFPHNFLEFIETRRTELFDRFIELFSKDLDSESVDHLRYFFEGDRENQKSLQYKVMEGLFGLFRERESLRKKVRLLRERIRRKEQEKARDKNFEQELGELKREKSALQKLIERISDRDPFNFFTDEGLIPNYAFPEAGVILRSVIYRRKSEVQEGQSRYETTIYEYERPAVSAIEELAPANRFYAGARKVEVDQVDMNVSEVETWRLCNSCSHMELVGRGEEKSTCPRCGSTIWADEGQKRQMLRMRQVFANTSDRDSRIGDDSDDREPNFYNKQMMVDFDDRHIMEAYRLDSDELPFGFEFLSKAAFREINFGEKTEIGENLTVAGVKLPRKGFVVCRYCGKVQNYRGEIKHALTCAARDQQSEKNLTDCIYLYREFSSEAIRILLPVTTFAGSERKLHSFIAALQLGLKRKFRGNIDHLQTTVCEEPVPESNYRKRFLVLYDRVPGGTGYLKQLMRSEQPMLEVFELALDALRSCSCNQEPGNDGCYRCLYAYRSSYNMAETSRDTAIELLTEILRHREQLVKTETLRNIKVNVLFDSELEARFIEALRRLRTEDLPVTLGKELVNGKPGYHFRIGERFYRIELQVNLGPKDGVKVPARADFVFYPARSQENIRPIVVFTDGYLHHRDRIGQDMAQRMAIAQSGRYTLWSLSWKDVENRYKAQGDYFRNYLDPGDLPSGSNFGQLLEGYGVANFRDACRLDSFQWFVRFLKDPDEAEWQKYAFVQGLISLDARRFASTEAQEKWLSKMKENLQSDMAEVMTEAKNPCLYGLLEPQEQTNKISLQLSITVEQKAVPQANICGMRLACCLFDDAKKREQQNFESIWIGYLRNYNLFQFLPHAFFVTQTGLAAGAYEGLRLREPRHPEAKQRKPRSDVWASVRELTDSETHDLLDRLEANEWPAPVAGYELADEHGEIVGSCELGWEGSRIAFLRSEEFGFMSAFEEAGWRAFSLNDVLADPDRFMFLIRS